MAKKKTKSEGTSKQYTLKAVKNHFAPNGEFVGEGTEKKVGSTEKKSLIDTGNWYQVD